MDESNFSQFLSDQLRARGLTLKRLSELSGIALPHLENMTQGHWEALPPIPYVRGYIAKLGPLLGFDPEEWWQRIEEEAAMRSSGPRDELPKNRFAPQPITKHLGIAAALVILLLYLSFQFPKIFGRPTIVVAAPEEGVATVQTETFAIRGRAMRADELFVNGERVSLGKDGAWSKTVLLEPGLNTIEVKASRFLGGTSVVLRQIIRETPPSAAPPQNATDAEQRSTIVP